MQRGKLFGRIALAVASAFALTVTAACGSVGEKNEPEEKTTENQKSPDEKSGSGDKTITIGWIPWDEDIVVTHLWKQELEKKGYTVELVNVDAGPLYTGMAKGDIDLFLDGWLPLTHEQYWNDNKANLEDLGTWYDNAKLTIAVPDYVQDVKTIGDLAKNPDQFGGKIVGIEPGAGLMKATKTQAVPKYGLEGKLEVQDSSTPAMLAALDKAVKAKEPIVVTLWRPHWVYAKLPIRDLEDPEGAMGGAEQLHIIARKGFSEEFPDVAKWLGNFQMNDQQLGTLEDVVLNNYKDDPAKGVAEWTKDNQEYVDGLTK